MAKWIMVALALLAFVAPLNAQDSRLLFVNKDAGSSDSNDCESWTEACATIQGAVTKLSSGGGLVMVGPGTYTEEITLTDDVGIVGSGTAEGGSAGGTIIKLPNSTNDDLIDTSPSGYLHGWQLRNLKLDGNSANNTSGSLLHLVGNGGGFNSIIENVAFTDAPEWCIKMDVMPVTLTVQNFTMTASSGDGGFYLASEGTGDNGLLRIHNGEVDQLLTFLKVDDGGSGLFGNTHMISISNLKWENEGSGLNGHVALIDANPGSESGSHPIHYMLHDITFANYTDNNMDTIIWIRNDTGGTPEFWVSGLVFPEVDLFIDDDKNSTTESYTHDKVFRGGTYIGGTWSAF